MGFAFFYLSQMKIEQITGVNVKGRDFSHKLGPVTIISGDNFSGKTAILDAIRIGLLGYHSKLGKQGSKLWKLAGQTKMQMSVLLDFADGQRIFNEWNQKTDGTVSMTSGIPDNLNTPAILLDTNEYFNRTSTERIAFIFEKSDPATIGLDDGELRDKIASIEVIPAKVCQQVMPSILRIYDVGETHHKTMKTSVQSWLSTMVESLKSSKKLADQMRKKAADSLQSLKVTGGTAPKDVIIELRLKEAEFKGVSDQLKAIEAETERLTRLKSQISDLHAIAGLEEIPETTLNERIATLADSISKSALPGQTHEETIRLGQLRAKSSGLKEQMQKLQNTIECIEAETQKHLKAKVCPTCKSKGDSWKESLAEANRVRIGELKRDIETLGRELEEVIKEGMALKTVIETKEQSISARRREEALLAEQKGFLADAKAHNARIASAREQLRTISDAGSNVDVSKRDELLAQRNVLESAIACLNVQNTACKVHLANKSKSAIAEAEAIRYQVEAEICKQAIAKIVETQEAVIAKVFDTILHKARAFTDGILRAPLAYKNGDFGMETDEGWVSSDVFSGLEQSLSYLALSVALAQDAPVRIALFDELGILSNKFKKLVIQRMIDLVATGIIEQFVACDASPIEIQIIVNKAVTIIDV